MEEEEEQKLKLKLQEKIQEQQITLKDLKKSITQKQEMIQGLRGKIQQLIQEQSRIQTQHQKSKQKYQEELKKVRKKPKNQDAQGEVVRNHEEHEKFCKKVEEKVQFHMSKYLAPLEKDVKNKIEIYQKKLKQYQDRDFSYQKPQFSSILVKIKNNDFQEEKHFLIYQELEKQRMATMGSQERQIYERVRESKELISTFRIQKSTKFIQVKEQAVEFWGLNHKLKPNSKVPLSIQQAAKEYDIYDDQEKKLREDDEVEKQFLSNSEYDNAIIFLKLRNSYKDNQDEDQQEEEEELEHQKQDDDKNQVSQKNTFLFIYKSVFNRVPLIKNYFILDNKILNEKWKESKNTVRKGFEFDDNHCLFMFLVLIQLILTFLQFYYGINLSVLSTHQQYILEDLFISPNQKYELTSSHTNFWENITSLTDLKNYLLKQELNYELFQYPNEQNINSQSNLLQNYAVLGKIRIRQFRTVAYECTLEVNPNQVCYQDEFKDEYIEKDSIDDEYYSWQTYKELDQVTQTRYVQGKFYNFPPNGYILDIDPSLNYDEYFSLLSTAIQRGLLSESMIGLIININLINKNDNHIIFLEMVLEQNGVGLYPSYNLISFIPNFNESENGEKLQVLQMFRLIFVIIQSLLLVYRVLCYKSIDFSYLLSLQGLLNLSIIVFSYFAISYEIDLDNLGITQQKIQQISHSKEFIDFGVAGLKFQSILLFQCIVLGCIYLRLVMYFTFLKPYDLIIKTLENSAVQIITNFIFVFFIISGFVILSMNYYKYLLEFNTFENGFVNLLLIVVGIFDFEQIQTTDFGLVFLAVFVFLIGFFLLNMITATYVDQYRLTYLDQGYELEPDWSLKESIRWFLTWLGQKRLKQCGLYEK